jgi:hypothetical protein
MSVFRISSLRKSSVAKVLAMLDFALHTLRINEMSKEELFRQCKLVNGNRALVTWIPDHAACVGNTMSLTDYVTDEPVEGRWTVTEAYSQVLTRKETMSAAHKHTKQRAVSDI